MSRELATLYPEHLATLCRRAELALEAGGYEQLLVYSGRAKLRFLDDREYPFTVNPQFKAWLPLLRHPDCWIVFTPGERPVLLYHQPVDFWYLPPADPSGYWAEHFDIQILRHPDDARGRLPAANSAVIGELPDDVAAWRIGSVNPPAVIASLDWDRAIKTAYELECMRRASARSVARHRAAERTFRDGGSEYDMHLAYCRAADHTEDELPYDNIVAVDRHGAVLHYQGRDRESVPQKRRRALLIDAGASVAGYACDITRTWSYRDDEFAELIATLDTAQQRLCARVRNGVDFRDLHLEAHRAVAEALVYFRIVRCSAEGAVESGLTCIFFPHGLGHYLGLQVHDVGGFQAERRGGQIAKPDGHPYLRLTRTLETDAVTTIEPGLYFIEALLKELRASALAGDVDWQRVESFAPCGGVRIEDNVRVLDAGHENLTRAAFASAP